MQDSYITVDSDDIEKYDINERLKEGSRPKAFIFD
jgi:hypothetical protein